MTLLDLVIVALGRGAAEVLPVGSAATQLIFRAASRAPAAMLLAVQGAAALAVLAYLWRDLSAMGLGLGQVMFKGRRDRPARQGAELAAQWVLAAAVTVVMMRLTADTMAAYALTPRIIAVLSAGTALALLLADHMGMTVRRLEHFGYAAALLIGLTQAIGAVPGIGTAALTVVLARFTGFEQRDAFRLSLLMVVPALLTKAFLALPPSGPLIGSGGESLLAGLLSFIFCLGACRGTEHWLRQGGFAPFAVLRLVLAVVLFLLARNW
ncbi:MAG: hypothetical protein K2Q10_06640 [Rhodospirillales bacterium]|nr:hypothetical protein [Rhodospirillales bacterium]